MSMKNSRKLLLVMLSIIGFFLLIGIIFFITQPVAWIWISASLFIGLLIAGGPLLRAYLKAKKQEELDFAVEISKPAKGVTCNNCGYELQPKETYCNNCGQKMGK
ncbi:MAG: zinc-ribbon domain-containing protein [Candidatus Heimdallarchaeaceae archaeon]